MREMNGLAGSMKLFPASAKNKKSRDLSSNFLGARLLQAHTPLLAADTRHVSRKLGEQKVAETRRSLANRDRGREKNRRRHVLASRRVFFDSDVTWLIKCVDEYQPGGSMQRCRVLSFTDAKSFLVSSVK